MTVLVTGGAGFIGSHFVKLLLKKNVDVINLDALTYSGNLENLKEVQKNKKYSFVKGNIQDPKTVNRLAKKCSAIVNFAAETHVDKSIADPASFIKTDVIGTHVLLEAARKNDIRMIQISTDEVYGSIPKGSFSESDPLRPTSPYSSSKASADLLTLSYVHSYGLDACITRSSNNYGPNQYPEKIIPLFTTNAIEGKKLPIYGSGKQSRDWIFVTDNCRAVDVVLRKGKKGQIYNIGTGKNVNNLDVTKKILRLLKKDQSLIKHISDRPGHDQRYSINNSKIRKLGWKPTVTFDQGIKTTVDWYQQNEQWWKKIKTGEYLKFYKAHYKKLGL